MAGSFAQVFQTFSNDNQDSDSFEITIEYSISDLIIISKVKKSIRRNIMPIYEYGCNQCGTCFEKLVFHSDDDGEFECPSCGEKDIYRRVSSFSCGSKSGAAPFSKSGCSPSRGFS